MLHPSQGDTYSNWQGKAWRFQGHYSRQSVVSHPEGATRGSSTSEEGRHWRYRHRHCVGQKLPVCHRGEDRLPYRWVPRIGPRYHCQSSMLFWSPSHRQRSGFHYGIINTYYPANINVLFFMKAGYYDIGIAGGVESMSINPMAWDGGLNPVAVEHPSASGCYMNMGQVCKQYFFYI